MKKLIVQRQTDRKGKKFSIGVSFRRTNRNPSFVLISLFLFLISSCPLQFSSSFLLSSQTNRQDTFTVSASANLAKECKSSLLSGLQCIQATDETSKKSHLFYFTFFSTTLTEVWLVLFQKCKYKPLNSFQSLCNSAVTQGVSNSNHTVGLCLPDRFKKCLIFRSM